MKKIIRTINRIFFLNNSRLLNQIKVFEFLKENEYLTKHEEEAVFYYFKKMLLLDVNKFASVNKVIDFLKDVKKEEKEKTSEEV